MPSQPDDVAKASYTEWIKLIGKRLGIGIDVYEQSITEGMINGYKEKIKDWDYTDVVESVISTIMTRDLTPDNKKINKRKAFNHYVGALPSEEQTSRFKELLKQTPESAIKPLWEQFQKHNKSTVNKFLNQIQEKLTKGVTHE